MPFPPASKWIPGLLLAVCLCFVVQMFFFPWSRMNCQHEDIGLDTGRVRHSRYLLFICISSSEEPTELTRELDIPASAPETRWRRVNTFSTLVDTSPHYFYHGALSQLRMLECVWALRQFTAGARRLSAQALLDRWRDGESYHAADQFLRDIQSIEKEPAAEQDVQPLIDKAGWRTH